MTSARSGLSLIVRQRLPFLPLLLCAIGGILVSEYLPLPDPAFAASAGLGLLAFPFTQGRFRAVFFCLLLAGSLGLLHRWQGVDSLSARFSRWVPAEGMLTEVTGIVATEPKVFSEKFCSFDLRLQSLRNGEADLTLPVTLLTQWQGIPPAYGDEVRVRGLLKPLDRPRNPGQFDFAAWSARRGIHDVIEPSHELDCVIIAREGGNSLVRFALSAKDWMRRTLSAGINDPSASDLILAMVLGDTASLPPTVKEEFRGTGTFHLFSVSGLHVGILAVILWQLAKPLRIPRRVAAGFIIPLLFFYVLMTGLQPASIRSAIMAAIVLVGFMANRPPVILNSVCAAAFVILLLDTNQLFNPGFQLSFIVVAAILILNGPAVRLFERMIQPDPFFPRKLLSPTRRFLLHWGEKIASLAAISLAAWVGSFPLILFYFHLVSLSALPANLVAVPISFAIMAVSSLSLGASVISTWFSDIFNQLNWLLAKILLAVTHLLAAIPGSYVYLPSPQFSPSAAEIVVFDLGSGGAAWLTIQGRNWLLDAGPARAQESLIVPFLRSHGLMRLDGLVITHGDSGHIGGALTLLTSCPPRTIVESPTDDRSPLRGGLHRTLSQINQPKSIYRAGDSLRIAPDARMEILYPPGGLAANVADDKAIVARLDLAGLRVLFLSDSGLVSEEWLLSHAGPELRSDIVIKGSHRSGSSECLRLIQAAQPKVVVATGAEFPATERISDDFVRELADSGIALFRQDQSGAVTIRLFPRYWNVSGFLNHQSYQYPP